MPTPEELEHAAVRDVLAEVRERLQRQMLRGVALYTTLTDDQAKALARHAFAAALDDFALDTIPDALVAKVEEAWRMGAESAARDGAVALPDKVDVSEELRNRGEKVRQRLADGLADAAKALRSGDALDDVESAYEGAMRALRASERDVRSTVNEALSEGTTHVADQHGFHRLWIPERDACVHCLAYAGEVAAPGQPFDGGLTFGARPLSHDPVPDPPLHPNCRCRVVLIPDVESQRELIAAYKREAVRSILRGWSLPSEREAVRLDAAERVLKDGTNLPKSVQDYARRALKRGSFERGRTFPENRAAVERGRAQRQARVRVAPVRREVTRPSRPTRRTTRDTEVPAKVAPKGFDSLPKRTIAETVGAERRDLLAHANPAYGEPGYGINCVHVVAAAELRRRGYDVEATPLPTELWGNRGRNLKDALDRWRTRDGDPAFTAVEPIFSSGGLQTNTLKAIREWGPGARGWVVLAWKGGGAHIFNAEVSKDGKTVLLLDGQTGQLVKPSGYFSRANRANVIRVDNLVPTEGVMEFVRPYGGRTNSGYKGGTSGDPASATS